MFCVSSWLLRYLGKLERNLLLISSCGAVARASCRKSARKCVGFRVPSWCGPRNFAHCASNEQDRRFRTRDLSSLYCCAEPVRSKQSLILSRVGRCFERPSQAMRHLSRSSVIFSMLKSLWSVTNQASGCWTYAAKLTGRKGLRWTLAAARNCVVPAPGLVMLADAGVISIDLVEVEGE